MNTMTEAKEAKQYLSSVTIDRKEENMEFIFEPPVPTEELSEKMFDYLENDVVDHGGDAAINTVNDKHCLTKIVIPKTFPRKIILTIFREFENGNICAAISEADLSKSRKKDQTEEVLSRRTGTNRAVEETMESEPPKTTETRERREGPRFSVRARITQAEKRNNDLRLTFDAYLYTGNRRNNRDYERVEAVIFEYNGVRKELSTSRIGKIRNKVLYFTDVFKRGEKLKIWPKAFPENVIELDVNPREEKTSQPLGPESPTSMPARRQVAEGKQPDKSQSPEDEGLRTEIEEIRSMAEKLNGEVKKLLQKIDEQNTALKEAATREEELKKKVEELDERKRIAEEKKARIAKVKAETEERARKEAEEKARKEAEERAEAEEKVRRETEERERLAKEEKNRQERELKRIGNAAADYLVYADIANLLPSQEKNRIEQIEKTLREGKVEGSTKKYAETLLAMRDKYSPDKIDQASTDIWVVLKNLMRDIDLPMSAFSASKSWVLWDMAKQTYLSEHRDESTPDYTLGNPMENAKICQQISDRHFGWELYRNYRISAAAQGKIHKLLQNSRYEQEALQLLGKDPNGKGTLRSIELEVLGGFIRDCMEKKLEAEENERENRRQAEQSKRDLEDALRNGTEMKVELARALLSRPGKLEIRRGHSLVLPKETFPIRADIFIEPGAELHVEAGTRLLFEENAGIVNRGLLRAQGTEHEPVVFMGLDQSIPWRNITIESDEDNVLQHCIVHGGGGRYYKTDRTSKRAVLDETTDAQFAAMKDGEDQKNKRTTKGGGIACINGCENTTLQSVHVMKCQTRGVGEVNKQKNQPIVSGEGGGIWNFEASPYLTEVVCKKNESLNGGGMYVDGGNPKIFSVRFEENTAKLSGGGLCIVRGSPAVVTSGFQRNIADNGGGVYLSVGKEPNVPILSDNDLSDNTAKRQGGGIYVSVDYDQTTAEGYFPRIEGGNINMNQAKEGGGVYIYHNISKWSYDFMHHNYSLNLTNTSGNTPDDTKEVFRTK